MDSFPHKNLVFISHATPDDNEFSLWLSTRLKLAGYEVWSDVTQLFGGEKFWEDIEDAILNYTCKFIIVITQTSLDKPGVKREIEYALEAEKNNGLSNYIIPLIIDDSSFSNQPYGFTDRNIIPFRNGWAEGFAQLIERFDRDNVQKTTEAIGDLGKYFSDLSDAQSTLIEQEGIAVTNWLPVEKYPNELNFYRVPVSKKNFYKRFDEFPFSWFEYKTNFASFCNLDDMKSGLLMYEEPAADPKLDVAAVMNNKQTNYSDFDPIELSKKMNFFLADAWLKTMREKGLNCYTMASGKESFFFPENDKYKGMLNFIDINGKKSRRQIIGYSEKNKMFWHYAVEVKGVFGYHPKICLIPHIVFTEDGSTPISDKNKMHTLRRGFCKNWWNPRWRDMLLTFLNVISDGKETIDLPVGSDSVITLSSRPIMLTNPVSIVIDTDLNDVEVDEDIEVDINFKEELHSELV